MGPIYGRYDDVAGVCWMESASDPDGWQGYLPAAPAYSRMWGDELAVGDAGALPRPPHGGSTFLAGLFGSPLVGCGGKVDLCDVFKEGSCSDRASSVPFKTTEGTHVPDEYLDDPTYGIESLVAMSRTLLHRISAANPCVLDKLASVTFDRDIPHKGEYSVERRRIEVNPEMVNGSANNSYEHAFVMLFRFAHEMGHHIFHEVLPHYCPSMVDDIRAIYGAAQAMGGDDFMNADAAKNPDEFLAVAASYYIVWPHEFEGRMAERIEETGDSNVPLARAHRFLKNIFGTEFDYRWTWDEK